MKILSQLRKLHLCKFTEWETVSVKEAIEFWNGTELELEAKARFCVRCGRLELKRFVGRKVESSWKMDQLHTHERIRNFLANNKDL